jgi:hypothetical protein
MAFVHAMDIARIKNHYVPPPYKNNRYNNSYYSRVLKESGSKKQGCRSISLQRGSDLKTTFHFKGDPDPAFPFNADPDPASKKNVAYLRPGLQNLKGLF